MKIADIEGHDARVSSARTTLAADSGDGGVWDIRRLWDLEQLTEVQHQEGHSKEVYCLAFQQDGCWPQEAEVLTAQASVGPGTGQCIMFLRRTSRCDWYRLVT